MPALALPVDSDRLDVQLAIGGFLAGYPGNTRLAYQQDLRCYVTWCWNHDLAVFLVRRTHIELFARSLEFGEGTRATTARRLSTVASFYRYCTEKEFTTTNPAINVRRPRMLHEATIHGLDRNEPSRSREQDDCYQGCSMDRGH